MCTQLAEGDEADWIRRRFVRACSDMGTEARVEEGRVVVTPEVRPGEHG